MERKKDKSYNQKIVFAIIHFIALLISFWVLFYPEQNFILNIIGQPKMATPLISRIIIFSCATLYFFRHIITLFVLLKREIPWSEVFGVGAFIAIIQVLFAVLTIYNKSTVYSDDTLPPIPMIPCQSIFDFNCKYIHFFNFIFLIDSPSNSILCEE